MSIRSTQFVWTSETERNGTSTAFILYSQLQKAWFFRGHYGGAASEGDMFSHATSNYNGLYLAYNKINKRK